MQSSETLKATIPLLLCGLGIAFAFQSGAFNIGAVGQMYVGALAAVSVAGTVSYDGAGITYFPCDPWQHLWLVDYGHYYRRI